MRGITCSIFGTNVVGHVVGHAVASRDRPVALVSDL